MVKKLVVVCGHPEKKSLGRSASEAMVKAGKAQGLDVEVFEAYAFPFITHDPAKNKYPEAFEPAVKAIESADYLCFNSPMWNFAVTGGLKNFIDGIMQPRRLFSFEGGKPHGLLSTEKMLVIWTSGGPVWVYKYLMGNPIMRYMKHNFKFCGVKKIEAIAVGGMMGKGDEKEKIAIKKFLKQIERYKF